MACAVLPLYTIYYGCSTFLYHTLSAIHCLSVPPIFIFLYLSNRMLAPSPHTYHTHLLPHPTSHFPCPAPAHCLPPCHQPATCCHIHAWSLPSTGPGLPRYPTPPPPPPHLPLMQPTATSQGGEPGQVTVVGQVPVTGGQCVVAVCWVGKCPAHHPHLPHTFTTAPPPPPPHCPRPLPLPAPTALSPDNDELRCVPGACGHVPADYHRRHSDACAFAATSRTGVATRPPNRNRHNFCRDRRRYVYLATVRCGMDDAD